MQRGLDPLTTCKRRSDLRDDEEQVGEVHRPSRSGSQSEHLAHTEAWRERDADRVARLLAKQEILSGQKEAGRPPAGRPSCRPPSSGEISPSRPPLCNEPDHDRNLVALNAPGRIADFVY